MQSFIVTKVSEFFNKGHERTIKAKKNIAASFIFKIGSVFCNLAIVPLTLHYLNNTKYGIWITLISIVNWFSFFDIGLGNGLRNKFTEAVANNNIELAKKYISTTYILLLIISVFIFILFYFINPLINWSYILNAPSNLNDELSELSLIVFGFFCLKFVLQLINTILTADQKPAINSLNNFVTNIVSLVAIYLLTRITKGSLVDLGLIVSSSPVIVLVSASLILFNKKYKAYKPRLRNLDFSKVKELSSLGIQFFIIQLTGIILFTTDNLIITQLFGPNEVTPYYISYKYFSILVFLFSIITLPFWSAFTDAFHKGDIRWIINTNSKLRKMWAIITFFGFIMLLLSKLAYKYWIGQNLDIPIMLSVFMFIYVVELNWGSIYVLFINWCR